MVKKLLLLTLLIIIGCSSDDTKENEPEGDGSYMELVTDGQSREVPHWNLGAEAECGNIFVSGGSNEEENRCSFSFQLTDTGHIVRISYTEKTDIYRQYSCLDFQPAESFTISNFSYDVDTGELYFEFHGTLYELKDIYNADELSPKHLQGKVHYKNTSADPCSFYPPRAYMDNSGIYFTDWKKITSASGVENIYSSTNGYRLHIWSGTDLTELVPDEYDLNPDIKIKLYKYIGPLQNTISEASDNDDWLEYTCEGRITINGHFTDPFNHTKGTFIFSAFDNNGSAVLELAEGSFETF